MWAYDLADRLAEARDHAARIRAALSRRRADAVATGDTPERDRLDRRLALTTERFRWLSRCARAARRAARLQPC